MPGKKKPGGNPASETTLERSRSIMANDNPNRNTSSSQCAAIRRHLEAGKSITAAHALDAFGCFRLAARINDLSNAGLPVQRTLVAVINRDGKRVRVAEYRLAQGAAA
jgi:hypothetical protein